jgi:hypothetical protein
MGFLIEIIQGPAGPEIVRVADKEFAFVQIQGHGFRGIGLQFQGMGATTSGSIDYR